MTKTERNDQLRAALRTHGTLTGAASEVGVDRGTVRRLVHSCHQAAVALWEGRKARIATRCAKHRLRLAGAKADARKVTDSLHGERERIRINYAELSYSQIRALDKSLAELLPRERHTQAAVRSRTRSLKEAEDRLLEHQHLHPRVKDHEPT